MSVGIDLTLIHHCVSRAFPNLTIAGTELLAGGLINTNIKVTFNTDRPPVVLRLYRGASSVCLKETALLSLLRLTVPVPEVLYAESKGVEGSPPFCIVEFVEGVTFEQLKRTNNLDAIHQAAASVGKTLALIGNHQFSTPGRLKTDVNHRLIVGDPYVKGPDPVPRILDKFLHAPTVQRRIDNHLREELHDFIWSWAPKLPPIDHESRLVHSDFGNRNILVREVGGRWQVAAVLDWEFAFSGSPLLDVGHFLRYERQAQPLREPYFSQVFVEHGDTLPDDWWRIARVVDLTGLVECLIHDYVPDDVVEEIRGLIRSTIEDCALN